MIKVQLTKDFGNFRVSDIMKNGVYMTDSELSGLLIYGKNVLFSNNLDNAEITLKKGTELILSDLSRDMLAFDILLNNNITLTLATNLDDFAKINEYHVKFVKSVVKHNKQYGLIKREAEIDTNWEDFLDSMLCLRDEDGKRPCEFCTEKCNEEWVDIAYEHYVDMKTYALPVTEEA